MRIRVAQMKLLLVFAVFAAIATAHPFATLANVRAINRNASWVASLTSPMAGISREEFRMLLGVDVHKAWADPNNPPERKYQYARAEIPDDFDPRKDTRWKACSSISQIRDQSSCGSCWAFGAASAMSDRDCIVNGQNRPLSAEDMTACSGAGSCNGGYPSSAYNYWHSKGLVTEACCKYSLPSCDHHIPGSKNPCPSSMYPTPKCPKVCSDSTQEWIKHKADSVYTVKGEANMMKELYNFGPCEGAFTVYEDFVTYTSGVYHHVSGSYEGGHAIKVLGYGVHNGEKYWLCANSWNEHWGEQGYFKIRRGTNECGIENTIWCGTAHKD